MGDGEAGVKRVCANISALLLPIVTAECGIAGAENVACDRACIIELTDNYLAALASHDPSAGPVANLPYKVTLADGSTAERDRQNMFHEPFEVPSTHIFKIGPDGQVHEIEAVGAGDPDCTTDPVAPCNSRTGWE